MCFQVTLSTLLDHLPSLMCHTCVQCSPLYIHSLFPVSCASLPFTSMSRYPAFPCASCKPSSPACFLDLAFTSFGYCLLIDDLCLFSDLDSSDFVPLPEFLLRLFSFYHQVLILESSFRNPVRKDFLTALCESIWRS